MPIADLDFAVGFGSISLKCLTVALISTPLASASSMFSSTLVYRFMHMIASLFFSLAAYVQTNDPDPELWIIIYLVPVLIAFTTALKPNLTELSLMKLVNKVLIIIYCSFAACILATKYDFEHNFSSWIIHEEPGREFAGVLLVALWTAVMQGPARIFTRTTFAVAAVVISFPAGLWMYVYFNESFRTLWPAHCQSTLYPDT